MGLIKKETLEKMWHCYREIEVSEKLLKDIEEVMKNNSINKDAQKLKDAFGQRVDFQLGIPSGSDGHRIFNVNIDLAKSVIVSHKAKKDAELKEANEQAKIELELDA